MDEEKVRKALIARVKRDGRTAVAAELKFSATFLRAVELGKQPVSERLAEALGYRRVVRFERIPGRAA